MQPLRIARRGGKVHTAATRGFAILPASLWLAKRSVLRRARYSKRASLRMCFTMGAFVLCCGSRAEGDSIRVGVCESMRQPRGFAGISIFRVLSGLVLCKV